MGSMADAPHRRFNPLTREWMLVSPHRARRPWLGQVEKLPPEVRPPHDPACYLCPGNERAGGARNPAYTSTFVFDNDFAALLPPSPGVPGVDETPAEGAAGASPHEPFPQSRLLRAEAEPGICRVVCFSPRHDLSIPEMSQAEVEAVVDAWRDQVADLSARPFISYVQVFENKGAMMGASNPHPHSQVWASAHVPTEVAKELASQQEYRSAHGSCLLCDYLAEERADGRRLVAANGHFAALVPFWATWPFELIVIPTRHFAGFGQLGPDEGAALADILRQVTARYDRLFDVSFPYSMGFHQAPTPPPPGPGPHFHAHYYPPLLRSATVRKFMVGYEMLGMPQRDLTPEQAAERLRSSSF
jgi:UDPglucose--hexose-1-phosphate uridylyltransferase